MAEPYAPEKKEFKILSSGTHSTNGATSMEEIKDDTPAPAEPASSQEVKPPEQKPTPDVTPPASEASAEPAKANEVKFGATKKEVTPSEPAKTEPTPQATPKNWEEVLKEQGFDEKALNLVKTYKEKGNLKDYVEAYSIDFAKMSPETVMRYDLQKAYPGRTQEELELLFDTEVRERFKLDPELYPSDTKEAKAGKIKLEAEAQRLRDKYAQEQAKFILPSFDAQAELQQQVQRQQEATKAVIDDFNNDAYVKQVVGEKKIVIGNLGKDVPDFNLILEDPDEVTGILTNPEVGKKYIVDKEGKLDRRAQLRIAAFASNPDGFIQAIFNYGKSIGKEELIEEKSNPKSKQAAPAQPSKETLNEAFASRGKPGRGG
jgi:hypothetical protein